jgi:hypothetical protein
MPIVVKNLPSGSFLDSGMVGRQSLSFSQHSSGLSISAYCTRECISAAAFYAWKKRLTPLLPALPEPAVFVPVNIASVPAPQIDTVL